MSFKKNWKEEKRSAHLYIIMANAEKHPLRKKLFENLALAAEDQAKIWERKIKESNSPCPKNYHPNFRTRLVGWLVTQAGPERLRYILSAMKVRGMSVFSATHHEHRHTGLTSANNLRAAVFGINDGLISNMSLILGITGAQPNHSIIILAGVAGLLAGACSMGSGEYISVKSQRELYEHQIALERSELELYPEEEAEELALIYQTRGLAKEEAERLAKLLISNPETALDTLAREELGLNPEELGSPIGAMVSSFLAFSLGAVIPMLPYFLGDYHYNLITSIILTAIFLFIIGTVTSLFTNRNAIWSGCRMLIIGAIAGSITYMIGRILGITLY